MGKPSTKTEILRTIHKELVKEHDEFDGQGRVSKKFIAPVFAEDGDPCFVIEYIYYGISTLVRGRTEGYGTWLSSYDELDLLVDDLSNQLTDDLGNDLVGVI